jgi:CyaY protein
MTENEFNQYADAALARIESVIDAHDNEVECNRSGNVLAIEFDNGQKIILNRHDANQEIWVAAKSGGFHYQCQNGHWYSRRDGSELFSRLVELFADQGISITLT